MRDMTSLILPPLIESPLGRLLIIAVAYAVTLAFSTRVVTWWVSPSRTASSEQLEDQEHATDERRHLGNIIGKCENIIIVTFILVQAETGLALIFAAKALVRREDIEKDPGYFLGGTLLNFVWSLSIAIIARVLVAGL
jgi:hypothetical protein